MNPEMRSLLLDTKLLNATWFNMYNPMPMETILKALREDNQMKSAEEITEETNEAGMSAIAFDCGTGRDRWNTFRIC